MKPQFLNFKKDTFFLTAKKIETKKKNKPHSCLAIKQYYFTLGISYIGPEE